jgi:hypothetical protein
MTTDEALFPSTYVDKPCHHDFQFVTSDFDMVVTPEGTKNAYVEYFECVHCDKKLRSIYVFLKEEEY